MPTEIKLLEGESLSVVDDYRTVYEKLLSTGWREPCEFLQTGPEPRPVTVNPTYITYFHES